MAIPSNNSRRMYKLMLSSKRGLNSLAVCVYQSWWFVRRQAIFLFIDAFAGRSGRAHLSYLPLRNTFISRTMSVVALSAVLAATAISLVSAQVTDPTQTFPATPLANKHFAYPTGLVSILSRYVAAQFTNIFDTAGEG